MKFKHRALSLLLSLMLVLTFMPAMAYATYLEPKTEGNGWSITSDDEPFFIQSGPATIQITTTVDGKYDLSYQWYVGNYNDDTGMDWTAIDGETESSFSTSEGGAYACAVTWNGETLVQAYRVIKENPGDDEDLEIINDGARFYLEGSKAEMSCYINYYGHEAIEYQWYKYVEEEEDWVEMQGETRSSCTVSATGRYMCVVTAGEYSASGYYDTVIDWRITNSSTTFYIEYGKSAKLTVETNYSGSDIEYQWSRYDNNSGEYEEIVGANSASYEPGVNVEGDFCCTVTAGGDTQQGWYYAEFNTDDYEWETLYPNATAAYSTGDGRDLEVDFTGEWASRNFPEEGDKITVKNGTSSEVYTFTYGEGHDGGEFVSENDEVLYFIWDLDGPQVNVAAGTLDTYVCSKEQFDHANKKAELKYSIDLTVPVKFITNVESIKFEPAIITLNAEDVKWVDDNGVVHDGMYDLQRRVHHLDEGEGEATEWYDCFADGDKITVTYNDGTPARTYTYENLNFKYYEGARWHGLFSPYVEDKFLQFGVNDVKIWYRGVYCTVKVIVSDGVSHQHTWDGGTVTTAPTCTTAGVKTYKCSGCGETKTESIAALGHDYQEVPNSAVAATSAKAGKAADMECTRCHDKKIGAEIPKTETPAEPQKGESFKVSGATVKVTSSGTVAYAKAKSAKSVTVPATVNLNGKTYKVTEISANAFKGNKAKTVTIGKNVKTLKAKAFNGSKVTTLNVKSKSLTKKSVKGSLKGSKVKTVKVKVGSKSQNKKYVKTYKKIFTKANAGRKVTVK